MKRQRPYGPFAELAIHVRFLWLLAALLAVDLIARLV
jgi:hypothetical protein